MQAHSTQYVLRKKPPGKVLASAHAVEREFQVLAALKDTPVPVPRVLCLCQDSAVIGTPFYVMEHVQASQLTVHIQLTLHCRAHVYIHTLLLTCVPPTSFSQAWRDLFRQGKSCE